MRINPPLFDNFTSDSTAHGATTEYSTEVMLRDWFAGLFAVGLLIWPDDGMARNTVAEAKDLSRDAYTLADAMLQERKRRTEDEETEPT
jgi:hypothetical protein